MAQRSFPVLVATDGSPQSRAAIETAIAFPWSRGSSGHGVVARATPVLTDAAPAVWDALLEVSRAEARRAERRLRRRWPDAEVFVTDLPPVPGILARARKVRARVLVLGSRGLGAVGRFLLGSVSRACGRQARSSVLVVRGSARAPRQFLPQGQQVMPRGSPLPGRRYVRKPLDYKRFSGIGRDGPQVARVGAG